MIKVFFFPFSALYIYIYIYIEREREREREREKLIYLMHGNKHGKKRLSNLIRHFLLFIYLFGFISYKL